MDAHTFGSEQSRPRRVQPRGATLEIARRAKASTPAGALATAYIDFRAAVASDCRESSIASAIAKVESALQSGGAVTIAWPDARGIEQARDVLNGLPLAHRIVAMAAQATSTSTVTIHARSISAEDFLALAPNPGLRLVVHLNAEEAALRWERADSSPGRRLAAATRLRSAGWNVHASIGAVRFFASWRDEYADLAQRAAACGFKRLEVTFAGENPFDGHEDLAQPFLISSRTRASVNRASPRQRREAIALVGKYVNASQQNDQLPVAIAA